jgi:hypothetical protein
MLNMLLDLLIRLNIGVLVGCIIDYLIIKGHTGIDNKEKYKNFMSNTSSIELFCYIFVLFMCVHLLFYFVSIYIFADVFNTIYCMGPESELPENSNLMDPGTDLIYSHPGGGNNSNLENTGNKLDNEAKPNFIGVKDINLKIPGESLPLVAKAIANGGIIAATITAGSKFAHNTPTPAGKLAIGIASVAFAAGGIIAKNIAGEVNQVKKAEYIDSDKSSFMPLPIESSGNSVIDLLNILQYFQSLEIFFVLCLGFYFIIMKLD